MPYEIIAVAADAKYAEVRDPAPRTVYLDTFQSAVPASDIAIRTRIAPESLAPAVRRVVGGILPEIAVSQVTTLTDQIDASIVPERLVASLGGILGGLAGLLAGAGIYGLLAYHVTRRVREIGIRMALGATRRTISGMVVREAVLLAGTGVALGLPVAWWLQRLARSLIAGLPQSNALSPAFAAAALLALAAVAAYLPARRASAVDPMEALRHD